MKQLFSKVTTNFSYASRRTGTIFMQSFTTKPGNVSASVSRSFIGGLRTAEAEWFTPSITRGPYTVRYGRVEFDKLLERLLHERLSHKIVKHSLGENKQKQVRSVGNMTREELEKMLVDINVV